jgi:hypothetical protein
MQGAMSVAGTSAIPYDYWWMGMEGRRRRRGEETHSRPKEGLFLFLS